jgi:hypothetical protein
LNTGAFPVRPEWFHSRLAGSGEVLIAIGLAIGAEQFGALMQLLGVWAIVLLFLVTPGGSSTEGKWIALAVVSCPAFIAWVASPKPMLLPGAMTTAALLLIYFHLREIHDKKPVGEVRNAFVLVCLLTMTPATMKLNFMLSGGVVGGLAVMLLARSKFRANAILIGIPMFFIILLPFAFWKSQYFGGGVLAAFVHAKNLPGHYSSLPDFAPCSFRDRYFDHRTRHWHPTFDISHLAANAPWTRNHCSSTDSIDRWVDFRAAECPFFS